MAARCRIDDTGLKAARRRVLTGKTDRQEARPGLERDASGGVSVLRPEAGDFESIDVSARADARAAAKIDLDARLRSLHLQVASPRHRIREVADVRLPALVVVV